MAGLSSQMIRSFCLMSMIPVIIKRRKSYGGLYMCVYNSCGVIMFVFVGTSMQSVLRRKDALVEAGVFSRCSSV